MEELSVTSVGREGLGASTSRTSERRGPRHHVGADAKRASDAGTRRRRVPKGEFVADFEDVAALEDIDPHTGLE